MSKDLTSQQSDQSAQPSGRVDCEVRPRVVKLVKTCEACPSQWDGTTDDGRQIYVRYRYGYLSIRIGQPGDNAPFAAVSGDEIFGMQIGDDLDGYIDDFSMIKETSAAINWAVGAA